MKPITIEEAKSFTLDERKELAEENHQKALLQTIENVNNTIKIHLDVILKDNPEHVAYTAPVTNVTQYGRLGKEIYDLYAASGFNVRFMKGSSIFSVTLIPTPQHIGEQAEIIEDIKEIEAK